VTARQFRWCVCGFGAGCVTAETLMAIATPHVFPIWLVLGLATFLFALAGALKP